MCPLFKVFFNATSERKRGCEAPAMKIGCSRCWVNMKVGLFHRAKLLFGLTAIDRLYVLTLYHCSRDKRDPAEKPESEQKLYASEK